MSMTLFGVTCEDTLDEFFLNGIHSNQRVRTYKRRHSFGLWKCRPMTSNALVFLNEKREIQTYAYPWPLSIGGIIQFANNSTTHRSILCEPFSFVDNYMTFYCTILKRYLKITKKIFWLIHLKTVSSCKWLTWTKKKLYALKYLWIINLFILIIENSYIKFNFK